MARAVPHARSGFTLIEVLVAVVLLATGIVVILEGLQGACVALEASRDAVRAARLAGSLLGESETALRDGGAPGGMAGGGAFPEPFERVTWSRRVQPVALASISADGADSGALLEVEVRIEAGVSDYTATTFVWVPPAETDDAE